MKTVCKMSCAALAAQAIKMDGEAPVSPKMDCVVSEELKQKLPHAMIHWLEQGDLTNWMIQAKITKHYQKAVEWCDENGAITIEEIRDDPEIIEQFMDDIGLKKLERKRLLATVPESISTFMSKDSSNESSSVTGSSSEPGSTASIVDGKLQWASSVEDNEIENQTAHYTEFKTNADGILSITTMPPGRHVVMNTKQRGNYMIVQGKELGSGTFGTVVKCYHKDEPGTIFAMKQMSIATEKHQRIALKEVNYLKNYNHENIVEFQEAFQDGNELCLVMTFATGGDLYTRIKNQSEMKQRFEKEIIYCWFGQCLDAMAYLHHKNKMHRDIKSQNILLVNEENGHGIIKLADFGLVKEKTGAANSATMVANTWLGTPGYMAPEILEEKEYGKEADVWAMGCVLFELCELRRPFKNNSEVSAMMLIKSAPPTITKYPEKGQDWSDLYDMGKSMLNLDPKKRPSFRELLFIKFRGQYRYNTKYPMRTFRGLVGHAGVGIFDVAKEAAGNLQGHHKTQDLKKPNWDAKNTSYINVVNDYYANWRALMHACEEGNFEVVKHVLEQTNVDVNQYEGYGKTPLIIASAFGNEKIVQLLLDKSQTNVNQPDNVGQIPLWFASLKGHASVVKCILDKDDSGLNKAPNDGTTPLIVACSGVQKEKAAAVVKELVKRKNIDVNRGRSKDDVTALWMAAHKNLPEVVRILLEECEDLDVNKPIRTTGATPLFTAAEKNHTEVVRLLVGQKKVDVNKASKTTGSTPIIAAARSAGPEVVRLLLSRDDIDVSIENKEGKSALSLARGLNKGPLEDHCMKKAELNAR